MRKILLFILFASIFLVSFLFINNVFIINGKADTINVNPGDSIQNAIDNANDSDIISIASGTYNENIEITKPISLTGSSKEDTMIIGDVETDETIKINGVSNVYISDIKIKSKTSTQDYLPAVYLNYVSNSKINDCIIENSNIGLWIKSSNDNSIESNIIQDNAEDGIIITSSSSNNIITDNTLQENGRGLYIEPSPSSNKIYNNKFLSNDVNARDSDNPTDNNWHLSGQGNYWSDYENPDSDNDGIGDVPYQKYNVDDQYPLGYFQNPVPVATIDSISPNPATAGQTVTFRGIGTDDGDIIGYYWYADGQLIGSSDEISYSFSVAKSYSITFKVIDDDEDYDEDGTTLTINPSDGNGGTQDNQKPTASINTISKTQANYGEKIFFSGTYSDPDGDPIISYEWSSSEDGVISSKQSFNYSTLSVGSHIIYFRVKDNHDKWSDKDGQGLIIKESSTTDNNYPVADAQGPYTGIKDEIITFNGSLSYDEDGDSISYSWDFGDDSSGTSKNPQKVYRETGTYTLILTVTDEHGLEDTDSTTVTISTESNNDNPNKDNVDNNKEDDRWVIPGFEIVLLFLSTIIIAIIFKLKK